MAIVWLARMTGSAGFEKRVALKTLRPDFATHQNLIDLFIQEASLAAELTHPNVVQTFDLGCKDGHYFMAMEYIVGRTLRQTMQALKETTGRTRLPAWAVVEIALQACEGLAYIHDFTGPNGDALCLLHRDVSPDNLMISFAGTVKIIDFGVARVMDELRSGGVVGKPRYMSPEQAAGKPIDRRSDLFSLGVLMYECITGKRPFPGKDVPERLDAMLNRPAAPMRAHVPEIDAELDNIVARAMTIDLDKRYAEALLMRDDLLAWQAHYGGGREPDGLAHLLARVYPDERQIAVSVRRSQRMGSLSASFETGELTPSRPPLTPVSAFLAKQGDESPSTPLYTPAVPIAPTARTPTMTTGQFSFPALGNWTTLGTNPPTPTPPPEAPRVTQPVAPVVPTPVAPIAVTQPLPVVKEPPVTRSWMRVSEPVPPPYAVENARRTQPMAPPVETVEPTARMTEPEADKLFEQGLRFYRDGKWRHAIEIWERACHAFPENRAWAFNLQRARERLDGRRDDL